MLHYEKGKVEIERLLHLDRHSSKASHGELLGEIYDVLMELSKGIDVFVRERAFSRFPHETQALFKVIGIADFVAWQCGQGFFEEIAPTTIKKTLTGSGKASKKEVADSLKNYIEPADFSTDDESDAVAVGIAWLLSRKLL